MSSGEDMPAWFDRWQKSSFAPSLANISAQFSTISSSISKVDERVSEMQQNLKDTMDGVKCLREDLGTVMNDVNVLKESVTCNSLDISSVKATEARLSGLVSALDNKMEDLERNFSAIAPIKSTSLNNQYDACEVMISGFPLLPILDSLNDEVNALLARMKLPDFHSSILKVRTWEPKGPNHDAATSRIQQGSSKSNKSRSLVVKTVSPTARDFLVSNGHMLKGITADDVFGTGNKTRFSLRPLWPIDFFLLYNAACNRARDIGYQRPFVRDGMLWMKSTPRATPTRITCASDLDCLPHTSSGSTVASPTPHSNPSHEPMQS